MIYIINKGATNPSEEYDPGGERNYEVGINQTPFATFTHRREDGLATCLRKAADAIEREGVKNRDKINGILDELNNG